MNRLKALFYSLLFNIIIPTTFFVPLFLIIYSQDGFNNQGYTGSVRVFPMICLVISMILVFVACKSLTNIPFLGEVMFSFFSGGKLYEVWSNGHSIAIEEHGMVGIVKMIVGIFQCIIIYPFKVVFSILKLPLILFSERYCDQLIDTYDEVGRQQLFGFVIILLAIVAALPASIDRNSKLKKYDLDELTVVCNDYYDDYLICTFSHPCGEIYSIDGYVDVYVDGEYINEYNAVFGIIDSDFGAGRKTTYNNFCNKEVAVHIRYLPDSIESLYENCESIKIVIRIKNIYFDYKIQNSAFSGIGFELNDKDGKPFPTFVVLEKNG